MSEVDNSRKESLVSVLCLILNLVIVFVGVYVLDIPGTLLAIPSGLMIFAFSAYQSYLEVGEVNFVHTMLFGCLNYLFMFFGTVVVLGILFFISLL